MDDFKNLEDIFKDNLKDFNVDPTDKVWKGIKSNLWYSDIQNVFRNFSIQPANSVWRTIAFRLWFKKFITYSPTTFNMYYVFSVLLIGFSMYFIQNQNSLTKTDNPAISHVDENGVDLNNLPYTIRNIYFTGNNLSENDVEIEKTDNTEDTKKVPGNIDNTEQNNINFTKFNATKDIAQNNGQNHEPVLVTEENENTDFFRDFSLMSSMNPLFSNLTNDFEYENFLNREVNENNLKRWHWSVEGFVMPMTSSSTYKVNVDEYPDFSKNYKGDASPSNTYPFGLLVQATHMNLSFQTGISMATFIDRPDYQTTAYTMDTTMVTQIIPGGYYNYVSIPILDLDYYLQTGDSEYIWVMDSTFIPQNDTLLVQQINAHKYTEYKRTSNTYTYVELPLTAGYTFSQGKINLTLRAGVVLGLLTSASGEIPSPYSESGTAEIQKNNSNKLMISGISSLEIAYEASSHISIVTAPMYRLNLFSVFNKNSIVDQRFRSFGIKFGVRYNL